MFKRTSLLLTFGFIVSCTGCETLSYYYSCHEANEIQQPTRAAIETSALQFAAEALAGEVDFSYSQITDDAKKTMSREQWKGLLDSLKPFGPFGELSLRRVLRVSGWGFMASRSGVAVCAGDSSHRDSTVSVALVNVRQQAYAVLETKGAQETLAAVLWLVPRAGGQWQVQAFHVTAVTLLARSASDFVDEARKEMHIGHSLNAMLLYAAAAGLASRGPFYHSGVQDQIQREGAQIVPPGEFRSQPPFLLEGPSGSFRIVSLAPTPVNKKFYLLIAHVTSLTDSAAIVQNNRDLMTAFAMRFPEYSHAFAGLVVHAIGTDGGREWRTQRENSQISRSAPH